jgi:hypothetical protein
MIISELFEAPQQCPECGGISFSDLILAEKKDACYHKVKASAKVWPSAYASGRLVQCRKKGAANYGNKSEGVAEGKRSDTYHIVNKDGKPASLASYADKESAVKDRDAKHQGAEVRQLGPRGKVKSVAEGVLDEAEELNVGDPVVITGNVEFEGKTGEIAEFGRDKRFVVVDLYNHGQHSFHSSDVSFNEYAGSDDEEARMHDAGEFGDDPRDDMAEAKKQPPEAKYDDEYDAMVARVKKLAGLGPMKTVYDPAKRQYRNMPTAQQPKK